MSWRCQPIEFEIIDKRKRDGRLARDVLVEPAPDPAMEEAIAAIVEAAEARSTSTAPGAKLPAGSRPASLPPTDVANLVAD